MDPRGKVVLVTGTSSGIGLATAVAAAARGFAVVATVRSVDRAAPLHEAAAAAGVRVDVRPLDVVTGDVAECVDGVMDTYGRLDALVNNAGVSNSSPTAELASIDVLRRQFEVNFFAVIAISRAALPYLRDTGGRLVTVSSVRGVVGQPFNEAYSAAKFAVEGFMEALAPTARAVGVRVCLVEPAAVLGTGFLASSTLDPEATAGTAYHRARLAYAEWVGRHAAEGAQVAEDVAAVVVDALTGSAPPLRLQTSEHARRYVAAKLRDPSGLDVLAMTRPWVTPQHTVEA